MELQKVSIDGWAYVLWAMLILLLPLRWVAGFLLAGAFHEMCHAGMICLLGGRIHRVSVKATGASMSVSGISYGQEFWCALAGPVGGLLLMGLMHRFPEMALVGLGQSIYNLLPVYPLDGGRAIRCVYCIWKEKYLAKKGHKQYNRDTIYNEV